jgi:hypothetical protein
MAIDKHRYYGFIAIHVLHFTFQELIILILLKYKRTENIICPYSDKTDNTKRESDVTKSVQTSRNITLGPEVRCAISWDIAPYILADVSGCFGVKYCICLQNRRVRREKVLAL